jgi:hypothetical protein
MVFATLAIAFLGLTVFFAVKAFRTTTATEDDKAGEKQDPAELPALPKSEVEIANLRQRDFNVGWVGSLLVCLSFAAGAGWLMMGVPAPTNEAQRSDVRVTLLAVGGAAGLSTIIAGVWLFYNWSDSVTKWMETSETRELRWVLIPVLLIVLGAGLVFTTIQPARAEERNNSRVRRVVYGANFALTVLLLLVALVVFNVVVTAKVSNRLDTTETGFHSLSDKTKQFLAGLKEPVTAYAWFTPETRHRDDIRQLLLAFQEAAAGQFQVKFLSEVANRDEIRTLRAKYPQFDLAMAQQRVGGAVVVTAGEDEKRHAVIPDTGFTTSLDEGGGRRAEAFQGENRLYRELVVLTDTETKGVVYFTQSNGELSINPQDEAPADRKATRLRAYLEKNYLDVRQLNFPLTNPTVPADASLVVVAEPRIPFSADAAAAIRKYISDPNKKGRLLVLAGIVPGPNNIGVMKTGLEEVLADLNVELGNKFVYTFPNRQGLDPLETLAGFTTIALNSRNDIAVAINQATPVLRMLLPREVRPTTANPNYSAMPLLASITITWLEENRIPEAKLEEVLEPLSSNPKVQQAKLLTRGNRSLAVVVTESVEPGKQTPVAAVYGTAGLVSDEYAPQGAMASAPIEFDLIGVTVDWLRGRPSIAASDIEAKKYTSYQFPPPSEVNTMRLEYLPIGLAFLTIVGLGAGVWVVRRK